MENFKILQEKENPLFERKEIEISIESDITPKKQEIEKLISEKFSSQVENIKVKKILGRFGSRIFNILANIYSSKENKDNIEPKSKKETEKKEESKPEETLGEEKK